MAEPPPVERVTVLRASLAALLSAYGSMLRRGRLPTMTVPPRPAMSVEAAMARLSRMLTGHEWRDLTAYLPPELVGGFGRRSALAASLVASLELARIGRIEMTQATPFGPIMLRRRA